MTGLNSAFVLLVLSCGVFGSQAAADDMPDIPRSLANEKPARVSSVEQMLYYKLVRSRMADNDVYVDWAYVMGNENGFVDEDVDTGRLDFYQSDLIGSFGLFGRRNKGGDEHLNLFLVGYVSGGYGQSIGRDLVIGLSYYHDRKGALHLGPVLHQEQDTGDISARMFLEGDLIPAMVRAYLELDPSVPNQSTGLASWWIKPAGGPVREFELGGGYNGLLLSPDWRTRLTIGPKDSDSDTIELVAAGDPENLFREAKAVLQAVPPTSGGKDHTAGLDFGVTYLRSTLLIDHPVGFRVGFIGKLYKSDGDRRREMMSLLFGWRGNWADDLKRNQSLESLYTTYLSLTYGGG